MELLKKAEMCLNGADTTTTETDQKSSRSALRLPGSVFVSRFQIFKLRRKIFFKKGKNATRASETTSRTELPRGLFLSAHFCRNIGFVKECEEVLIIDGGAVVLAVGLGGEG